MFPQMASPELAPPEWETRFVDYLYLSFTNAAAFSPTDVMPLARWAKLTMLAAVRGVAGTRRAGDRAGDQRPARLTRRGAGGWLGRESAPREACYLLVALAMLLAGSALSR